MAVPDRSCPYPEGHQNEPRWHQAAADAAAAARNRSTDLQAQIADVLKQQHLNGGDALEASERYLKALDTALAAAIEERAKFRGAPRRCDAPSERASSSRR